VTDNILADAKSRMSKSVEAMKLELVRIRTGRASTALLDHLMVDYYGTPTPLNQAAGVSVADSRTLAVQPWEKAMIPIVEKAIMESNLGLNPMTAGETIRIPLPPLTEERRKEMTKVVRNEGESGRISIRNIRRDANTHLKELLKKKEINEDDEKKAQSQVQELTNDAVAKIDQAVAQKEAEVMEV
jgi:ribosome recycling factor